MNKICRRTKKIMEICILHFAYCILLFCKKYLYKRNIWLIGEKKTEARDNGYHFFKYIREKHPEINAYYVIKKGSADLHKIKKYGNIVWHNSMKHYIYYLAALVSANSQPFGAAPSEGTLIHRFSYLRRKEQKVIFLQHGITQNELSHYLDFSKTGFDIFSCSAGKECEFIRKTYGYPEENAQLLGFCRYDNLPTGEEQSIKQILIMPTFRTWLKKDDTSVPATKIEEEKFKASDYYIEYSNLLASERLKTLCEKYGYKIVFYPHYALQSYINCFKDCGSSNVIIADRKNFDVQQLLIESKILVTDFSSVHFDFAYMEKPEVLFQFDEEKFRGAHYKKGYFDYRDNGFGPVVVDAESVIDEIEVLLKRDGKITDFYLQRIKEFFDLRDKNNCERTYNAIIKKLQEDIGRV